MTRPVPERWKLMNDSETKNRWPVTGLLALTGGVLLGIGSFLVWATVSGGGQPVTARGVDASLGFMTLAAGLVALGVGIAVMMRWVQTPELADTLAAFAIFAGVVGCGIGIYGALTTQDSILDAAAEKLAPSFGSTARARALLDQAVDAGRISFTVGIGVYIVIAGGVLALAGGIAGHRRSGADQAALTGTLPATPPQLPAGTEYGDVPPARLPHGSDSQADVGAS
jgi:multisubunit Na+/H+ antiporter MnhF subunit